MVPSGETHVKQDEYSQGSQLFGRLMIIGPMLEAVGVLLEGIAQC